MIILAIESSCDETAAALVEDGRRVYANVISSQIMEHRRTGGVVPEVAARRHAEMIIPTVDEVLKRAKNVRTKTWPKGITLQDIDAIAVTQGPGLMGCLMVGNTAANALSLAWKKILIPVHHIEGHLYGSWLTEDIENIENSEKPFVHKEKFPILILTVSGGHNDLVLMHDHGRYEVLGKTLDDAAGEAFDKVARMMGLPYPGGPSIQQLALEGNEANGYKAGNTDAFLLPRAMMSNAHSHDLDFSFSGLKTAMRNIILKLKDKNSDTQTTQPIHHQQSIQSRFDRALPDLAASFEYTVCETLLAKLKKAAELHHPKEIHIAGGVSANLRLRTMLEDTFPQNASNQSTSKASPLIRYPALKFCTDNAAMIASTAYFRYMRSSTQYKRWHTSLPHLNFTLESHFKL